VIVDASVWPGAFLTTDVHHLASRGWLNQSIANADPFIIPTTALSEIAGAIARSSGIPLLGHRALAKLLQTPNIQIVPIDAALGEQAAKFAASLRLRGADAAYVAVADALGIALVTWDQELLTRAADAIRVRHP
jgi:predicted nucleic acid-binding protein